MRDERRRRRERFIASLEGGVAVLPAARTAQRNADTDYEFRQNSDFYYLTGFPEPEAIAVLSDSRQPQFTLFVLPRDREAETWNGYRFGIEGAREHFDADEAYPLSELATQLPQLFVNAERVYACIGEDDIFDRLIFDAVRGARKKTRRGGIAPDTFVRPERILHEMRLHKSAAELETMRAAARITAEGFAKAMRGTAPGLYEYQIEALLEGTYLSRGAQSLAYTSIVAGGANGTILHYNTNRRQLVDGTLLLVDSGCELDMYASDVTRTWPVNGKFSPEQRALYEIVLAAHAAATDKVRAGLAFDTYHQAAVAVITEGLRDLGVLQGKLQTLIEQESYRPYYMHRTGHWLGLDVHDAGRYTERSGYRPLAAGMTLTVEPGIYIAPDAEAPEHFRGIGIRIEDDLLVTTDAAENLTEIIPKSIDVLEAIVGTEKATAR